MARGEDYVVICPDVRSIACSIDGIAHLHKVKLFVAHIQQQGIGGTDVTGQGDGGDESWQGPTWTTSVVSALQAEQED
jgi:hypothetical protein